MKRYNLSGWVPPEKVGIRFNPGDQVFHPEYRKGSCVKVNQESRFMTYLVKFRDGTVAWFSEMRADFELRPARIRKSV